MFGNPKKQPFIRIAQLSTLIAEAVEIKGDVSFTGGMRIDGRVKGDVVGRRGDLSGDVSGTSLLVLSDKGRIEGRISCGDAVINGIVVGDLDVQHRLELQSDARVRGAIRYRQLQMDTGATVNGQLVRVEEAPLGGNVVELGADKAGAVAERR